MWKLSLVAREISFFICLFSLSFSSSPYVREHVHQFPSILVTQRHHILDVYSQFNWSERVFLSLFLNTCRKGKKNIPAIKDRAIRKKKENGMSGEVRAEGGKKNRKRMENMRREILVIIKLYFLRSNYWKFSVRYIILLSYTLYNMRYKYLVIPGLS